MPQLDQARLFGIKPGYAINPTPASFHDVHIVDNWSNDGSFEAGIGIPRAD